MSVGPITPLDEGVQKRPRRKRIDHELRRKHIQIMGEQGMIRQMHLPYVQEALRDAVRTIHLARCFLRGVDIRRAEQRSFTEPDWLLIETLVLRFADGSAQDIKQRFAEWKFYFNLVPRPARDKERSPLTILLKDVRTLYHRINDALALRGIDKNWWKEPNAIYGGNAPRLVFASGLGESILTNFEAGHY